MQFESRFAMVVAGIVAVLIVAIIAGTATYSAHNNNLKTKTFNEKCIAQNKTPVSTDRGQLCL